MKKIKKNTLIAIITITILTAAFIAALIVFLDYNKENRQIYEEQKISVSVNGQEKGVFTFEELERLCAAENFKAVYKPSDMPPLEKVYTGIEVKGLLIALGVDLSAVSGVVFKASDGLQKVYAISDIMADKNVFIANKVNGKPFNKGVKIDAYKLDAEDGGPYVVIKASDLVSQNRVKLLTAIEVI